MSKQRKGPTKVVAKSDKAITTAPVSKTKLGQLETMLRRSDDATIPGVQG